MNNEDKTPKRELAELLAGEPDTGGRKLSFHEQCGAFAALYGGAANRVVTRAFLVSPTTVSNIAGCLEYDPNPWQKRLDKNFNEVTIARDHNAVRNPNRSRRYEDIAREFEALGAEEFNRRYLTKDVLERIARARMELRSERGAPPPLTILTNMTPELTKLFNQIKKRGPTEERITHIDNYLHHFNATWNKYAEDNFPKTPIDKDSK